MAFLGAISSVKATIIRIDFNGTISSLSAPFDGEPLFGVGSTIAGYYVYDDSIPLSYPAGYGNLGEASDNMGRFPALIEFEATLNNGGNSSAIDNSLIDSGDIWLTGNDSDPFEPVDFDQFSIIVNFFQLGPQAIAAISLTMRGDADRFTSGLTLSDTSTDLLNGDFSPYQINIVAGTGLNIVNGTGPFSYSAAVIPEPSITAAAVGFIVFLVAYTRKRIRPTGRP